LIVVRALGGLLLENAPVLVSGLRTMQLARVRRALFAYRGQAGFQANWWESVFFPRYLELLCAAAARSGHDGIAQLLSTEVIS
jgi:hypothetical protein